MKAVKILKPYEMEIVDVDIPVLEKNDEVLIKVTYAGICGSDIGIYNGSNSLATYPRIIGHEFGGIVVEKGNDVSNVTIGDKVSVNPIISCGTCYACRIGRSNVCSSLEVMGVHRDGGFSQFVKVNKNNVYKVSNILDEKTLSIVEPYSVGMEINNRAQITAADKVLIMGSGPIGICAMQIAKSRGANVMMTDIIESRLIKAKEMGADEIIRIGSEDLGSRLSDFTDNEGIPVIIDTVCSPASFEESIRLVCPAGRVVVIGLKDQPSNITMAEITKKEITIVGSRLNCNCFDSVISLFENGMQPTLLVTEVFHYTEIQKAFDKITTDPGSELKVIISFEHSIDVLKQ